MNKEKPLERYDLPGFGGFMVEQGVSWWSRQYGIPSDAYVGLHLQGHETLEANGSVQF